MLLSAAILSALALAPPPAARLARQQPQLRMMAPPPSSPKAGSGYYVRPSAALERGGGFYVPGLEGTRLRVVGAAVLSVGLVLNRVLSPGEPQTSQVVSEALGALGCAIVFGQSAAQQRIEAEQEQDELRAALASRMSETQELGATLAQDEPRAARSRWAAASLLRITPARAVVWVGGDGGVMLRCGRFPPGDIGSEPDAAESGARRLLELSRGGGSLAIELADGEPTAPLPSNSASVAVCPCGDGVLALASEQSAAFSPTHVRWLERSAALLEQGGSS
jgi:hypothetical protein